MKPALIAPILLALAGAAGAENYRAVWSPSLSLEVYIDHVADSAPESWCQPTLPLRIVTGEAASPAVLQDFLPRVGNLLQNQCPSLTLLPWQLTDKTGARLASGSASRAEGWRVELAIAPAATLTASAPANRQPLQHFALPDGCHFRTWWDASGSSLFIPQAPVLRCSAEGWLEGAATLTLHRAGQTQSLPVLFLAGYPLSGLRSDDRLRVAAINNQRLLLASTAAPDSWLLLPFDRERHVWHFTGALLLLQAASPALSNAALASRVSAVEEAWRPVLGARPLDSVYLVDALPVTAADPSAAAWRRLTPAP
ncbi:hypothetical protein [Pantoea sp. 1.19]|uniref:hypothetical protein n=1 Tax=Pantoea sp. 1.19 TaxID=1925589 RepID=UPI000948F6E7|nr:hypothetical protein [Pantoea sp. 1.19]